ncbi:peptidylprolyl isomerase [Lujinxingia vulgaris]|nr:peptidylprolyl isomerase [Lujinxingia vulgaris]
MSRFILLRTFLLAALALLAFAGAGVISAAMPATAHAAIIDRVVAQVNDEIVTLYELENEARTYLVQQGRSARVLENPERRDEVLREVLDDLVNRLLINQAAAEVGESVSDEEVNEWMRALRQQQGLDEQQFMQMVAQYGIDFETYREVVRDNLLRMRMVSLSGRSATVADSEIDSIYRRRHGSSGTERYIRVRHILVEVDGEGEAAEAAARQRASELRAMVEEGADFAEVAREHSEGPGQDQGGMLGEFRRGQLESTFEQAAFAMEPGQLSEPVRTPFGYHIIEVVESEERVAQAAAEQRARIRAELQEQAMNRQIEAYLQTLRAKAYVDIRY